MSSFDVQAARSQFPALNQVVDGQVPTFLDGPGGTQVPERVLDAIAGYLGQSNSNLLNSAFFAVQRTHDVVADARKKAAVFVNAPRADDIVFGATMSAITAHLSRSISLEWEAGDEIIVTALDHYSNVSFWQRAAEDRGAICHVVNVDIDECTLDYEHLESLISSKTKFVAFTLASNVCGSRVDAQRVIAAAKAVGALTYVDSVHAAPHFLPDVQALDCDFLVCSAYKFYGPHLGFLYGKQEHLERLNPYKVEPATDKSPECWEMGTKSFEALAGFSSSIDYMTSFSKGSDLRDDLDSFYQGVFDHEQNWIRAFLERAQTIAGLSVHGISDVDKIEQRSPTFSFTIDGHHPQAVLDHLASSCIAAGAGHFYAVGLVDALGLSESGGIIRVGGVHYNTIEELDRLFDVLHQL